MRDIVRVLLFMPMENSYYHGTAAGVGTYARPHLPWAFMVHDPHDRDLDTSLQWEPCGVIGDLTDANTCAAFEARGIPMVNVGAPGARPDLPRVGNDDEAIGAIAADHFLSRGFHHFAHVVTANSPGCVGRAIGFRERLAAHGHRSHEGTIEPTPASEAEMVEWLRTIERPVGLLATHDRLGAVAINACERAALRVPEDVAVVGVDNNVTECNLCYPPLSSVVVAGQGVGYEAARVLHRLLQGESLYGYVRNVPPIGIVTRQSSDILAVTDPDIACALRFIRERAVSPLCVQDIARATGLNRRSLERKFRAYLDRTPLQEILRVRIELAKTALAETDAPMAITAASAGLADGRQLSTVFRRVVGMTPSEYRSIYRPGHHPAER